MMNFRDPREAFDEAIEAGRLSANERSDQYAGNFMYMGHQDDDALFKNTATRAYLPLHTLEHES